jgi:hypothetical protein
LATAVKPIVDGLGWVKGFMTTIHSYTNDQNILDAPHKDLAPRAQRRDQHHSDVDRRGQSAVPDDPGSRRHLRRLLAARADADGVDDLPRRANEAPDDQASSSTRCCAAPPRAR